MPSRITILRSLPWLASIALHVSVALFFLVIVGGAAYEEGTGQDEMVAEQGNAPAVSIAWSGQDVASIEPIEATPVPTLAPTPPEQEVKEVQDQIITSNEGPEQETEIDPNPEKVEQPHPSEVAMLEQETAVEQHESSGAARKGGDTNAQSAYLGSLRSHLEKSKINPRTSIIGTAVVHFVVDKSGRVVSRDVKVSSGSKQLDDAAIASIDKASPFPAMPHELERAQLDVTVPFKFSVR